AAGGAPGAPARPSLVRGSVPKRQDARAVALAAEQAVDAVGDRLVALGCRVLVAERSPRARVAEPVHQFLRARARGGGHRAGDVPEVVQANAVEPERPTHPRPLTLPGAQPERTAARSGEDVRVRLGCDPPVEVRLDLGDERRRQHERALPRVALRWTDEVGPLLRLLPLDAD